MIKNIMKFILILLIGMQETYAQENKMLIPFWMEQDSLFSNLSKTNIAVLYNRVHPWADLSHFRPEDTLSFNKTMQAWHELYLSTYDRADLLATEAVREKAISNKIEGRGISIGYIHYDFHSIAENAIEDGYIYFNPEDSLYYDGTEPHKAYHLQTVTLPLIASEKLEEGSNTFYFDPEMLLSNKDAGDIAITISYGGQGITLRPGESGSLDILSTGGNPPVLSISVQTATVTFPFPYYVFDPILLTTSLTVDQCNSGNTPIELWSGAGLTFQGYNEAVATQGKGEYTIWYKMNSTAPGDCGDMRITKPIIIMDGFDPQNGKQAKTDDIWDLLGYTGGGHLGDELRTMGYDIVVLNFPMYNHPVHTGGLWRDGGSDYIERNAMVLIKLIQDIKAELAANGSNEEIVVIGPSMGGQISRYALKYMENQLAATGNQIWNHKTKLFVSFDSPNHGANIPVGVQMAVLYGGYYRNEENARNKYKTHLSSVAAKQMLIHQLGVEFSTHITYLGFPEEVVGNITNYEPFHNTWQNSINTMGYPNNLRKIALSNGNNSGQYAAPGSVMVNYKVHHGYNGNGILGLLAEMKIRNLPATGTGDVFSFNSSFIHPYTNNTPYGNIDAAPGGLYRAAGSVVDELTIGSHDVYTLFGLIKLKAKGTVPIYQGPNQCFMPIVSTLGYNNPNFNWAAVDINNSSLVCEGKIAFDNYLTEAAFSNDNGANADHVKINPRAAKWVKEEIQYGQQNCPTICASKLNGAPNRLCPNNQITISLNSAMPANASILWEVSNGLTAMTATNANNSLTVKATGNNSNAWVKATITSKNGSGQKCAAATLLQVNLIAGLGSGSVTTPQVGATCDYQPTYNGHVAGNTYEWKKGANGTFVSSGSDPVSPFTLLKPSDNGVTLSCKITNSCGNYIVNKIFMPMSNGTPCMISANLPNNEPVKLYAEVFPNPTSGDWIVQIPHYIDNSFSYSLFDINGRLVFQSKDVALDQSNFTIPGSKLNSGLYFLKIKDKHHSVFNLKLVKH